MAKTFAETREEEIGSTGYLGTEEGRAYARVLGAAQDADLEVLREVTAYSDPARCPDDALDTCGLDSSIERFAGESDASYRPRLEARWETHRLAGSAAAIAASLHKWGLDDVRFLTEAENGPLYGDGSWWSAWRLVLGPDYGTTGIGPALLGTNTVLGAFTLGVMMSSAQRAAIKQQAWRWKFASGVPFQISFVFGDMAVLGVTTTLGAFKLGPSGYWMTRIAFFPSSLLGLNTILGSIDLGAFDLT